MIKVWMVAALLQLSLIGPATAKPVLEWCLDDHPNWHNYPENSPPYGLTVDLMKLIAERANIELRFSPNTPFARCLAMMKAGKTDLMTSLNYSDERASYMHLIPYDTAKSEVVFLRSDQPDIAEKKQLHGKVAILVRGYAYNAELPAFIGRKQMTTVEATSLDNAFAMLLLGRADVLIGPAQSSINVLQKNPRYHQQFKKASFKLPYSKQGTVNLGLAKNSQHSALHQHLKQVIDAMVADGTVAKFRFNKEAAE